MEFSPIFFPAVAVEAFSVVVTASMVGVVKRLLVAAFGSIAPQVIMFIDGGQVSFVCPSGLTRAYQASPPRCSLSTSSALFRHFRSCSRRQRWSPASDETGCETSPARPQRVGSRRRQYGYTLASSVRSRSGEFGVGFWCVGGLLDEEILRAGLSSYPSSEDSSDKSSELRAHQISVGGSFGGPPPR